MDNKAFFQHPDMIRALSIHETVMQQMVNTLARAQQKRGGLEATGAAETKVSAWCFFIQML